jgi:filamentous hemagglutinin family protein
MFIEQKQLFHWRRVVRKGREIACCTRLIAGILLFAGSTALVIASPTGGSVTGGDAAAIVTQPDADTTTIDQFRQRVDIDWTGFDTTTGQSVTFNQPNSSALAINRISGNRTRFDGTLNANGRIFLINQNGITFGNSAQVNAGSLLATTAQLDRCKTGYRSFTFSGNGYGTVVNNGNITVSDGGFAVLAAPNVENNGFIQADLGQVELDSTNDFTVNVDLRGDGLITFAAPEEWLADETGQPGVTSTGTLQSHSGHVYLNANMASAITEGVVNLSGVVDADQFVSTPDGGLTMVAGNQGPQDYPGGTIQVESTGDINIGGGTDIHAVGGEQVAASFHAARDINAGAAGDPVTLTLKASATADGTYGSRRANARASLEMIAASHGGAGNLTIHDGTVEVTADATGTNGGTPVLENTVSGERCGKPDGRTSGAPVSATATVVLEGAGVEANADFNVHARAETLDTGYGQYTNHGNDTDALATLDVLANGEVELDTSDNVISYGQRGDLTLAGNIDVGAESATLSPATSRATSNVVLSATGSTDVSGEIGVDAQAVSVPGANPYGSVDADATDANAALLVLGGTPPALHGLLHDVSLNRVDQLGTLSDMLTLANLDQVLSVFGGLVEDPATFLDRLGGIGSGSVSYTGNASVTARADLTTTGAGLEGPDPRAEATAAGIFAAGGDVTINTDPVTVDAQAYANQLDVIDSVPASAVTPAVYISPSLSTEARSFLVAAAGLGDLFNGVPEGGSYSQLNVRGDLSAMALEQASRNGEPSPGDYDQLAAAVTALVASGDITVRGADPLATADPAQVRGRASRWQLCYHATCAPVTPGVEGLLDLAANSADANGSVDSAHLAQIVIESLHGNVDIQPKHLTHVQPAGLFTDPIGPIWPGNLPLRFAADGRMLVATGIDTTRPPQIVALDSSIESAIQRGGDPSTLLPPTASGGCVAAGRDAFTVSGPDYFDRLISAACDTGGRTDGSTPEQH